MNKLNSSFLLKYFHYFYNIFFSIRCVGVRTVNNYGSTGTVFASRSNYSRSIICRIRVDVLPCIRRFLSREIRNLVSVRFQAGFNACTTSLHFSPVREKDWRARASRAKPLFEIISSQIDILRKSHCVSKCMRKSHSVSNCMRKSHYISK
jgi:hypothetical protein